MTWHDTLENPLLEPMPRPRKGATPPADERVRLSVIGAPIDALDWAQVEQRLSQWAQQRESRYVCICNVHSVVSAHDDPAFRRVIEQADLAPPDGAPVAWMLRRLGQPTQTRISGPDLMLRYCALAAQREEAIFLYGNTPDTLAALQESLPRQFPGLRIAGTYSPPFRPLTAQEDDEVVRLINQSGAGTVWVSLGCPKQERWMAEHRGRVQAVMIGVGAAFDFHCGKISRAPQWMQDHGLEWLHRLGSEPRRLARRYLVTNTLFLIRAARQLLTRR
jgi:N-acetylglucosaminyldiphosphoundecaprenol N-acetyl-beta-D-mannosaminyltransferase